MCAIAVMCSLLVMGCASVPSNDGSLVSRQDAKNEGADHHNVIMIVINDPRGDGRKFGGASPLYRAHVPYDQDPILHRVSSKLVRDYKLISQEQWPIKSLGVHCIVVNMPNKATLDKLKQDNRVAWVQNFNTFDTQFFAASLVGQGAQSRVMPARHSSAASLVNTRSIKTISPDMTLPNFAQGVKIMVIDTGANIEHPDFSQASMRYKNFVQHKKNALQETHGTAVTGLLGAKNTLAPVKGLTQDASLYHYRGCWQNNAGAGKCSTLTLALALDAAVKVNPDIINLSLSGPPDRILDALLRKLIRQGSIVVSAHDTQRSASARFPRAQSGVIYAYGMTDAHHVQTSPLPDNTFTASSTALSLAPNGAYDTYTGHSIAAPQVTATIASLISTDPSITKETVAKRLEQWLTVP